MAYHMLGYTREEYIKKVQGGWSRFLDIDLREVMRDHHEEILTGEPFELTALTETKDGNKKWPPYKPYDFVNDVDFFSEVDLLFNSFLLFLGFETHKR